MLTLQVSVGPLLVAKGRRIAVSPTLLSFCAVVVGLLFLAQGVGQDKHGEMGSGLAFVPPGHGPMRHPVGDATDSTAERKTRPV